MKCQNINKLTRKGNTHGEQSLRQKKRKGTKNSKTKHQLQLPITDTLRKHTYSNILKFYNEKKRKFFQIKKNDIFHISAQNIDCGYSLESPRRGGSNEYPQFMYLIAK